MNIFQKLMIREHFRIPQKFPIYFIPVHPLICSASHNELYSTKYPVSMYSPLNNAATLIMNIT